MGAHISSLLLRMFVMYYPELIVAGKVYKAIPPLYAIPIGSNKFRYFTDNRDYVKYIQRTFQQSYKVTTIKNDPLTNTELTNILLINNDYLYEMKTRIADTYNVDPILMEIVLYHYFENGFKINYKELQKQIKSVYRFMDVEKVSNSYVITGTIQKSNFFVFNDRFVEDRCQDYFKLLGKNKELRYKINGEVYTLYQLMSLYKSTEPKGRLRYKGLGEMEDYQLAESTLYPGSDRTLIRYTMEDAKQELESIREYESDMKKFLKLARNVTRDDLID